MAIDLRQHAAALKPVLVQEYLRSRGWSLSEDASDTSGVVVYRRNGHEIEVPQRPEFVDYARRIQETVEAIATTEGLSVVSVFDQLTQPPGDTLAIGVSSLSSITPERPRPAARARRFAGRAISTPGPIRSSTSVAKPITSTSPPSTARLQHRIPSTSLSLATMAIRGSS